MAATACTTKRIAASRPSFTGIVAESTISRSSHADGSSSSVERFVSVTAGPPGSSSTRSLSDAIPRCGAGTVAVAAGDDRVLLSRMARYSRLRETPPSLRARCDAVPLSTLGELLGALAGGGSVGMLPLEGGDDTDEGAMPAALSRSRMRARPTYDLVSYFVIFPILRTISAILSASA